MTTEKLSFNVIDVFTNVKYTGNPLAIVQVPTEYSAKLTQEKKQAIAREFNLSETVFLHQNPIGTAPDAPVKIDIFTTEEELPFAGHPTVGTSWFLLSGPGSVESDRRPVTLKTKAGDIPANRQGDSGRVQLRVPIDFKEHAPIKFENFKSGQPNLRSEDFANGIEGVEAVASIVKGMTFVLLRLNSEEALRKLQGSVERIEINHLGEWDGLVALYAFYEGIDGVVRTRMLRGAWEDPATGSAASTLGGWLGKRKGAGKWKIEIVQGVEMGRRSEIEVQVEVGEGGAITKIELGGEAVNVMEGLVSL